MELKYMVVVESLGGDWGSHTYLTGYTTDTHITKCQSLRLSLLVIQQHIGDPAADGEKTARFWALQGAL